MHGESPGSYGFPTTPLPELLRRNLLRFPAPGKQRDADVAPLKESDSIPADPEPGYGWEKLFAEELCRYYKKDHGFETRIMRFHNVDGPLGTFEVWKQDGFWVRGTDLNYPL